MNFVKHLTITLLLSLFIAGCNQSDAPSNTTQNSPESNSNVAESTPSPQVVDEIAEGRKVFAEYCVKCHKEDGTGGKVEIEGQTLKAEDLTSAKMIKEPDTEYMEVLRDGIADEGMPSFKKLLNEDQMKQVVKYIRSDIQK